MNMSQLTFEDSHFPKCIILQAVFWHFKYSLGYTEIEGLMKKRGVDVDYSIIRRWVIKYAPLLEPTFRAKRKAIGANWTMDDTYIKCDCRICKRKKRPAIQV